MENETQKRETQTKKIKAHLLSGKGITPIHALNEFGCFRLAARICELRKTMNIKTTFVNDGNKTFARYTLTD